MQIVTLTTDWGYSDYYVGAVKAKLFSTIKNCQVVDRKWSRFVSSQLQRTNSIDAISFILE